MQLPGPARVFPGRFFFLIWAIFSLPLKPATGTFFHLTLPSPCQRCGGYQPALPMTRALVCVIADSHGVKCAHYRPIGLTRRPCHVGKRCALMHNTYPVPFWHFLQLRLFNYAGGFCLFVFRVWSWTVTSWGRIRVGPLLLYLHGLTMCLSYSRNSRHFYE